MSFVPYNCQSYDNSEMIRVKKYQLMEINPKGGLNFSNSSFLYKSKSTNIVTSIGEVFPSPP